MAAGTDEPLYYVRDGLGSTETCMAYHQSNHDDQLPPCDYMEANDANAGTKGEFDDLNHFVALLMR